MSAATPLLSVEGIRLSYKVRSGTFSTAQQLRAVDDVGFSLERGQSLAIVGESGCGKSSLARSIVGLERPAAGRITLDGDRMGIDRDRAQHRRIQMVFQDPVMSLNPRLTPRKMLHELLRVHGMVPKDQIGARSEELMELVGLSPRLLDAHPRHLSGGQRQRVGIARALALEPDVLVADEPVSALDVSVQATILALLADLRDRLGLALVFISHDLGVVRSLCEQVAVMYLGRIVESGPTDEIFERARHPYTQALLRAAPSLSRVAAPGAQALTGEPPSPTVVLPGCRFEPRCAHAIKECSVRRPPPTLVGESDPEHPGRSHLVECFVRPAAPTPVQDPAFTEDPVPAQDPTAAPALARVPVPTSTPDEEST